MIWWMYPCALRPLDFTGKMRNRWSYAFAFGAVARFVISLILNDAKDDSVPYPTGTQDYNTLHYTLHYNTQYTKLHITLHSVYTQYLFGAPLALITAWHGVDQPVAPLKRYWRPVCFHSSLQLVCVVESDVSYLPLNNIHLIQGLYQVRTIVVPL